MQIRFLAILEWEDFVIFSNSIQKQNIKFCRKKCHFDLKIIIGNENTSE